MTSDLSDFDFGELYAEAVPVRPGFVGTVRHVVDDRNVWRCQHVHPTREQAIACAQEPLNQLRGLIAG